MDTRNNESFDFFEGIESRLLREWMDERRAMMRDLASYFPSHEMQFQEKNKCYDDSSFLARFDKQLLAYSCYKEKKDHFNFFECKHSATYDQ